MMSSKKKTFWEAKRLEMSMKIHTCMMWVRNINFNPMKIKILAWNIKCSTTYYLM